MKQCGQESILSIREAHRSCLNYDYEDNQQHITVENKNYLRNLISELIESDEEELRPKIFQIIEFKQIYHCDLNEYIDSRFKYFILEHINIDIEQSVCMDTPFALVMVLAWKNPDFIQFLMDHDVYRYIIQLIQQDICSNVQFYEFIKDAIRYSPQFIDFFINSDFFDHIQYRKAKDIGCIVKLYETLLSKTHTLISSDLKVKMLYSLLNQNDLPSFYSIEVFRIISKLVDSSSVIVFKSNTQYIQLLINYIPQLGHTELWCLKYLTRIFACLVSYAACDQYQINELINYLKNQVNDLFTNMDQFYLFYYKFIRRAFQVFHTVLLTLPDTVDILMTLIDLDYDTLLSEGSASSQLAVGIFILDLCSHLNTSLSSSILNENLIDNLLDLSEVDHLSQAFFQDRFMLLLGSSESIPDFHMLLKTKFAEHSFIPQYDQSQICKY